MKAKKRVEKKIVLTAAQVKPVVREVEFSVNTNMAAIDRAFPSVAFTRRWSNGGVSIVYRLSGPTVWIDKIERQYAY